MSSGLRRAVDGGTGLPPETCPGMNGGNTGHNPGLMYSENVQPGGRSPSQGFVLAALFFPSIGISDRAYWGVVCPWPSTDLSPFDAGAGE